MREILPKVPIETVHNKTIFHAYDVRGLYPEQLNFEVAYKIAHAYFRVVPGQRYVIGRDMRRSSPELTWAFIQAASEIGREIDYIGLSSTDMLYFATGHYGYDGGIMITASHNPEIWNGIKLMDKSVSTVSTSRLEEEYKKVIITVPEIQSVREKLGRLKIINVQDAYSDHVLNFINPALLTQKKIVIDAGNGMGGISAGAVFQKLENKVWVDALFFEPDDRFPHHQADPKLRSNTQQLSERVVELGADLGVALDGDADRCFLVDEKGDYVSAHHLIGLLTKIVGSGKPGEKILYDANNNYPVTAEIEANELEGILTKTGRSNFNLGMSEHSALFGAETSGHFYFRDNFHSDNGIIPVLLVLEYLSKNNQTLSQSVAKYRQQFFASEEANFTVNQNVNPEEIFNKIKQNFPGGNTSEIDGIILEHEGWRMTARMSNTESKLRVNVEAHSQTQIEEYLIAIHETLAGLAQPIGNQFSAGVGNSDREKFFRLLKNLWYTWNPHHITPIIDLYGDSWRQNPPPGKFKSSYGQSKFNQVLSEKSWHINETLRLLNQYLDKEHTWFDNYSQRDADGKLCRTFNQHPIAYFSLEFGLTEWLQIYSGGLGVLAGDFMKEASDMGVPMTGVGIFYHQGFFHQEISPDGQQIDKYVAQDPKDFPIDLVTDSAGEPIEISIEILDHEVYVRAWKLKLGRNNLLLLDTNFERNLNPDDRMITAHLYGGDEDTRIRQELVLGIGGPRILKALGLDPSIYHMNEGHSGFLVLEIARQHVEEKGKTFEEAKKLIDEHLVFTNHTLKQAGNDIFTYEEIKDYISPYLDNLRTSLDEIYNLGKDDQYADGKFSMTSLALRSANKSNAVSILHGQAAKNLWPEHELIPITNGVHMPTWVSPEIHKLLDKYVGEHWHDSVARVDFGRLNHIPKAELWHAHTIRRKKLVHALNTELALQLDPEVLTIVWARRFASYKRPDLIMEDQERLAAILNNHDRPVQLLVTGKAHPRDTIGQEVLQRMYQTSQLAQFKQRMVFIPDYNWHIARRLVSGADIWLNNPIRYQEASGTSGMKAAANGVIQFTTLDGWTDEVNWDGIGWKIPEENPADTIYSLLENEITQSFYTRNEFGYSDNWTDRMIKSMQVVHPHYSTTRMMRDYLIKLYIPVLKNSVLYKEKP